MTDLCTHCGEHLASPGIFCPRCGVRVTPPAEAHHEHPPAEKAPVKGAFSGLYFGLIAAPFLLIVGVMLCLTGLGMVFGIPIIIMAILAPLAGPLFGLGVANDVLPDHAPDTTPPLR